MMRLSYTSARVEPVGRHLGFIDSSIFHIKISNFCYIFQYIICDLTFIQSKGYFNEYDCNFNDFS